MITKEGRGIMEFKTVALQIVDNLGGAKNFKNVTHCATRLRIEYYNKEGINFEFLQAMPEVFNVVKKEGQLQLIIGTDVSKLFPYVTDLLSDDIELEMVEENEVIKKNFSYYVNVFGSFFASIFMPMIPALIAGGIILSIRVLLINYFGMSVDSGTAVILLAIFNAAFVYMPIYIGYNAARTLKIQPILGALLGAVLVYPTINGAEGLSFLGISLPAVTYSSSVIPVILGICFMFYVDKALDKIVPPLFTYILKPICTMIIVVPITLIVLGPLGTLLSNGIADFIVWLMDTAGIIAVPFFAAAYPYLVMLGLDKALIPVGVDLINTLGYNPLTIVGGFISNLCIGGTALALATSIKSSKEQKGMVFSCAVTALCGVTEPAFYGTLLTRPVLLIGTAIGAITAGLFASIFGFVGYIQGGTPGLLTFLYYLNPDGTLYNLILAFIVAALSIGVSFTATKVIIRKTKVLNEENMKKSIITTDY